jgi:hypothetical protein
MKAKVVRLNFCLLPSAFCLLPSAFSLHPSYFSLLTSNFSLHPSYFSLLTSLFHPKFDGTPEIGFSGAMALIDGVSGILRNIKILCFRKENCSSPLFMA